ncbi:aldo/keto reductase family oxidoreductase [Acinetobacter pittii]|uniref:aldo/keto reductase family oxidoreductase n=1 Tax=Acinetobacter pittii TaxID=48296 RepID=UPI001901DB23|nr:aldo/keto reductase family oxidoreductase [Acinetobacter pittii]MBJ8478357.1 aldo/keto reductase family oxidoreductase [Acinetobacter pittii]MCU4709986.1 aldo/keto reductase family oxidoreductase [Acinetobacter pittii]
MSNLINLSDTYKLGNKIVNRMGYGAMQLAGPHAFGPPKDKNTAINVLKTAIQLGINHIDTSDFYGPHITNQIIREALHPYQDDLTIVTKIGANRGEDASWIPTISPDQIVKDVHDNLRNLGLHTLDVVNFRVMFNPMKPSEGSIEEIVVVLAKLREEGLIQHIGLSNVTEAQIIEAEKITDIVCVQNQYNLFNREDDVLIDKLTKKGIAYVPFFPLGGFTPFQSDTLFAIAKDLDATPKQVALAWLLKRSPNILLIPGTSSIAHLEENSVASKLILPEEVYNLLSSLDNNFSNDK